VIMVETIKSEDITLGKLFEDFYLVPDYQREYVWGDEQIEDLLSDIYSEFSANHNVADHEYFIGSIVVCPSQDDVLELIDGQQRLTTTYIFLCGVRDYLVDHNQAVIGELPKLIRDVHTDSQGADVFSYRLVLQYDDSADVLTRIANTDRELAGLPETTSIDNIRNAYAHIRQFLESTFGSDVQALRRFYRFFTNNVKLIRIRTRSRAHALKIFETINARGKSLDSMDLLKNLLFMRARPQEFDALKTRWKELVDTLHKAGEKPLRFLRYFIHANYAVETLVREEGIYEWFVENEPQCRYREFPLKFADSLLVAARCYSNYLEGKDAAGALNRYLQNISDVSRSGRQHFILLLAARQAPASVFLELCRHIENLVFVYAITGANTREFERKFQQWATEVRGITTLEELDAFVLERLSSEKKDLALRFYQAIRILDARRLQKYRLKYVLAKLTQYVNEQGYGAETPLFHYTNSAVHIEHILPQSPSKAALEEFEESEGEEDVAEYIQRLGNLALAEQPINIHLGNRPYSEKKAVYPQSQFLLTQAISRKPQLGANTSVDRAVRELEPYQDWCPSSVEARQGVLTVLARKVWNVPEPVVSLAPADFADEKGTDTKSGGYRLGSAIGDLYRRLSDEQWHQRAELEQVVAGRANFDDRIGKIKRRGKHRNLWVLDQNEGAFRLTYVASSEPNDGA
jgi:uncharacterized protein with ParB-like and HNH nuclease domain